MRPIFTQSLRQRRWFIMWWSIGVLAFIGITLAVYPSIRDQTEQLNKSFANLSPQVTALFSDTGDFFSPAGYLSSQIFYLMLPLLMSILAIGLGSSLLAREERDGTLELLLARPVSRGKVLGAKALAGLCAAVTVGAVALTASVVLANLMRIDVSLAGIAWASVQAVLIGLLFGSLALFLTALGRAGRGASIGIASLLALGSYIISSLESAAHWLRWPAKLLPYHYYHPAEALYGHFHYGFALSLVAGVAIFMTLAYLGFQRRDIG